MTAYYNEIDPYCCKVLAKQIKLGNLPAGDIDDRSITEVKADEIRHYTQRHFFAGIGGIPYGCRLAGLPDDVSIDTGGFPCQDISRAGERIGLTGERSSLWYVWFDLIRQLRPARLLVENVPGILTHRPGEPAVLSIVLGQLASIRYDAEWSLLSACALGAPHTRERLFMLAYPDQTGRQQTRRLSKDGSGCVGGTPTQQRQKHPAHPDRSYQAPAQWAVEPDMGRVAYGVSDRLHRLSGLGNAVVPQCVALFVRSMLGELCEYSE